MRKVIIVVGTDTGADIQTAKEEIIKYLGRRLVEETDVDLFSPIRIKKDLDLEDLEQINEMSKQQKCCSMIMECDEKGFDTYSQRSNVALVSLLPFPVK